MEIRVPVLACTKLTCLPSRPMTSPTLLFGTCITRTCGASASNSSADKSIVAGGDGGDCCSTSAAPARRGARRRLATFGARPANTCTSSGELMGVTIPECARGGGVGGNGGLCSPAFASRADAGADAVADVGRARCRTDVGANVPDDVGLARDIIGNAAPLCPPMRVMRAYDDDGDDGDDVGATGAACGGVAGAGMASAMAPSVSDVEPRGARCGCAVPRRACGDGDARRRMRPSCARVWRECARVRRRSSAKKVVRQCVRCRGSNVSLRARGTRARHATAARCAMCVCVCVIQRIEIF